MPLISLEWAKDSTGYRIERRVPPPRLMSFNDEQDPSYEVIARKGGKLREYDPLERNFPYRALAVTRTPEDARLFCTTFGFLRDKDAEEERVDFILAEGRRMNDVMVLAESERWGELREKLKLIGDLAEARAIFGWHNDREDRPTLRFELRSPRSLLDACYLQFLMAVTDNIHPQRCARPGCWNFFVTGPRTGRRSTAEYCSPTCQKAHQYEKRKAKESTS